MLLWGHYTSLKCFDISISGVWGPCGVAGAAWGSSGMRSRGLEGLPGAQTALGIALSRLGRSMGILAALLGACTMQKCCSHRCGKHIFRICVSEMLVSS